MTVWSYLPSLIVISENKIHHTSIQAKLIKQCRSPWQNGVAERFVLSVRNDLLDHVIIFNKEHLRSLMKQYVEYYNDDRCHLSVNRDSPKGRKIVHKTSELGEIIAFPRLGGLHHKYEWKKVA